MAGVYAGMFRLQAAAYHDPETMAGRTAAEGSIR